MDKRKKNLCMKCRLQKRKNIFTYDTWLVVARHDGSMNVRKRTKRASLYTPQMFNYPLLCSLFFVPTKSAFHFRRLEVSCQLINSRSEYIISYIFFTCLPWSTDEVEANKEWPQLTLSSLSFFNKIYSGELIHKYSP